MASCTKCGATLIAKARFCATCGSPVTSGSVAPSAPPPAKAEKPETDPFAKTMLETEPSKVLAALPAQPVSPMAASVMAAAQPPGRVSQPAPAPPRPSQAPAPPPLGTPWNVSPVAPPAAGRAAPQGPTQYQPPLPTATHAFVPGALVLVHWADGNRYPGTIVQVSAHHVFVVFPNGTQQWVDARYVTQGP